MKFSTIHKGLINDIISRGSSNYSIADIPKKGSGILGKPIQM